MTGTTDNHGTIDIIDSVDVIDFIDVGGIDHGVPVCAGRAGSAMGSTRALGAALTTLGLALAVAGCLDMGGLDPALDDPGASGDGDQTAQTSPTGSKASYLIEVWIDSLLPNEPIHFTNSLQDALDFVSIPYHASRPAQIYLKPATYRHDNSTLTVEQIDWREKEDCQDPETLDVRTAFLLQGRTATTLIQGTTGNPQDVIVWGRVPAAVVNDPSQGFHGLSVVDSSGLVTIRDLAITSDGGFIGNGIGDASLNVTNSRVDLHNTLVLGNKRNSNPLACDDTGDQEGILAYGSGTYVRIYDSAVGGNVHTGIMAAHAGRVRVERSLVRGNGWVSQFQGEKKGHGVTAFHNATAAPCLNSNTEIDVINSHVMYNTGNGVYLRGEFINRTHENNYNTITNNGSAGFRLDGGAWPGAPSTTTCVNTRFYILHNRMQSNTEGNIQIGPDVDPACIIYQSNNGPTVPGAPALQDPNLWNKLIAVHNSLGAQVTCQ